MAQYTERGCLNLAAITVSAAVSARACVERLPRTEEELVDAAPRGRKGTRTERPAVTATWPGGQDTRVGVDSLGVYVRTGRVPEDHRG